MYKPLVSVIIPTHNSGPEINRAINSIMAQHALLQQQCGVEIIVVNDASGEEYAAQLDELLQSYTNITLLHQPTQQGPAAARNLGIQQAKGSLISFLDADDEWPADKLSLLLPYFEQDTADVAGGKIQYVVEKDVVFADMVYEDDHQRLTHVHLGSLLVNKAVFDNGFYFDESLTYSEDIDWWLRLRENGIRIVLTEATTLLYHVHGQNMSVNKSLNQLQILKVLHTSLQRRAGSGQAVQLPQVKDFRAERENPLISIVLPLYNGIKYIDKALKSVLAQTYTNWELLIIDDGSTDGGAEWIEQHYPAAKITRQKNAGVAAARNTGIKLSQGEVIAFLDQDDEWLPGKLQVQWDILKHNPYCGFVTCDNKYCCYDGYTLPPAFKKSLAEEVHRSFIPSALLVRRYALAVVGGFDTSFEMGSDTDIIRRLRNAGFKEDNANEVLLHKWFHGDNESLKVKKVQADLLQMLHKQIHGK